jgi:hypothetical protein
MGGNDFLIRGRRPAFDDARLDDAKPSVRSPREATSVLFIDGLPASCTSDSLAELFARYGSIIWTRTIVDGEGRCSGAGYVDMSTPAEAEKAAAELDGKVIAGNPITVMLSNRPPGALRATRFLHLNVGKGFCKLCIGANVQGVGASGQEMPELLGYLYECSRFQGVCFACHNTTEVFAAS